MTASPTDADSALDLFCRVIEDECERQEDILAACRAMAESARAGDTGMLRNHTASLELLLREVRGAEGERKKMAQALSSHCGVPADCRNLTQVVASIPNPWKGRLRHLQERLQQTLSASQQVVKSNTSLLSRAVTALTESLQRVVSPADAKGISYTSQGTGTSFRSTGPALMDQKG